ncbi:hypothetical protein F511_38410 [Dorcoceras hygrometricum]|uniref:Uncharacterized protein n=1 Tax=Dorcoceras hygrometricum TaxID=472368 RepID=A0A2Z7B2Z4_9LAMI|nr:hypothetical protein F511_38410 [Dorcoceras hygrometricum]
MPPRRTTNRQTEQGSTSTEVLNAAATPMETLLKRFQSFKTPTLTGTESAIECENWLEDIEKLFEALDYTDERRVVLYYWRIDHCLSPAVPPATLEVGQY